MRKSRQERFDEKWAAEPNTGCWLWVGAYAGIYGTFGSSCAGQMPAHRASYEIYTGPIPPKMHIDHLCVTPACVNPKHLEAVTPRENIMRSSGICSRNARKTHCPKGHEYAGANLYTKPCGSRVCVTCRRAAKRRCAS